MNSCFVFSSQFPGNELLGIGTFTGIGNIEYISEFGLVAAGIHKGDALAATVDPTPELVPHAHLCAGGGIRPLGVDEELIPEAVFMIPGGGGEEVHVLRL